MQAVGGKYHETHTSDPEWRVSIKFNGQLLWVEAITPPEHSIPMQLYKQERYKSTNQESCWELRVQAKWKCTPAVSRESHTHLTEFNLTFSKISTWCVGPKQVEHTIMGTDFLQFWMPFLS